MHRLKKSKCRYGITDFALESAQTEIVTYQQAALDNAELLLAFTFRRIHHVACRPAFQRAFTSEL